MDHQTLVDLRAKLRELPEKELWNLIRDFFRDKGCIAFVHHGRREHGIDVAVRVPRHQDDLLGLGYEIAIQVKSVEEGRVGLQEFRQRILGQLIEGTYYPAERQGFNEEIPRRLVWMLTSELTEDTWVAVRAFNKRHRMKIEVFELDDLVSFLNSNGYLEEVLSPKEVVGQMGLVERPPPAHDIHGEGIPPADQLPPELGQEE